MSRVRKVFSRKGKMERKQDEVSTEPKAKPIDITAGLNSQAGCPLFTTIPPEVRNYIFLLALSPCEDLKRPYSLNAFFYRPDTQYALITDIALLCTCRRIYGEARFVPWHTREHILWGGHPSRCPPSAPMNPTHFFSSVQPELKRELGPVRLFTQLWWLESSFATLCAHRDASESLRVLRVTLRNSDWWYWEYNQPLKLKRDWTNGLKELQTLETFELEMEAIERDKQQLMDIVKGVLTWRIPAYGGRTFITNNKPASQLQWLGTSEPKGSHVVYDHAQNLWIGNPARFPVVDSQTGRETVPKPPARPPVKYEVVLIRWKLESVEG